ncbi:hypothetical protein Goshw_000994 [Gossypium schwendimanii]|uniref:Uncharacterized protein n=1 Tax=Gossypium schwendimanii TaxID=34291 RepID=A0A7J9KPE4_GOSSC|nr:hypothetical protein [Gossypium schwendimanii]
MEPISRLGFQQLINLVIEHKKGDIATNMLGVGTPDMHFVYILLGWEGSLADGRVIRDAISRRHGLKVPHGKVVIIYLMLVTQIVRDFSRLLEDKDII